MNDRQETLREMRGRDVIMQPRNFADRIEAAARRERGNAAAMREALSDMCYASIDVFRHFVRAHLSCLDALGVAFDKAKAALAAPPRNCDRFASYEEAVAAWCAAYPNWTGNDPCLGRWLFAPAEGEAK